MSTGGTEANSNGPLRRTVVVKNPQGLHIRPAAAFAEVAARYVSRVTVANPEGEVVDGKFWPDLLLLKALQGTPLELVVDGADAPDAIDVLAQALAEYHEEE